MSHTVPKLKIAFVGVGLRYLKFGVRTYARNVILNMKKMGLVVDDFGPNKYPHTSISPILSFLASIVLILKPWWRYDVVITNDGSAPFVIHPLKVTVIHHSAKEEMRKSRYSVGGLVGWLLQVISIKTSRAIISISHSTLETIKDDIQDKPNIVIWNGVDHEFYKVLPGDWKKNLGLADQLTISYAGRRSAHKNFGGLANLIAQIGIPLTVIVLGDTLPDSLLRKFEEIPQVTVVNPGYVSRQRFIEYLNASDFYTNVSKLEGFGLIQVEAMACGNCVLSLETDENSMILGNGGIAVSNLEEMSRKIRFLWENPEYLKQQQDKAVARAKLFNWEFTAKEILRFVETQFRESRNLLEAL